VYAVERFGQLGVHGNRIVAADGRVAQLRGVSLFWSQWLSQFYDARTVRWLRDDWCIDVIRAPLGVHRDGYLAHPARERHKIAAVVEAAIELGIYVVVDWHAHVPEVDAACEFFGGLAAEFGAYPNLIYETWNEPEGQYLWARDIKPYHERVIASIRAHDARNLIVAGTPHWSHRVDFAARDPLAHPHLAYSLHFYSGSNKQTLRNIAGAALGGGIALLVTEWGSCRADGRGRVDQEETLRWFDFLEEHRLGYLNWSIVDKDEAAAALRPGASPAGGWSETQLTESGAIARRQLRSMQPRSRGKSAALGSETFV
jgi:endoglucanase